LISSEVSDAFLDSSCHLRSSVRSALSALTVSMVEMVSTRSACFIIDSLAAAATLRPMRCCEISPMASASRKAIAGMMTIQPATR
jgi:hypothetical protein